MEKRLKKLTVLQIRKVYCKMMKTKQTKLKKKDIISKLLKPLRSFAIQLLPSSFSHHIFVEMQHA